MNEFDNDHQVILSFNFSLMFKNETAYRECIEHIESEEFGQLFEERVRQQMNENVVNVSIVDIRYDANVTSEHDEEVVEYEFGFNVLIGLGLSIAVLCGLIVLYLTTIRKRGNISQTEGAAQLIETGIEEQ